VVAALLNTRLSTTRQMPRRARGSGNVTVDGHTGPVPDRSQDSAPSLRAEHAAAAPSPRVETRRGLASAEMETGDSQSSGRIPTPAPFAGDPPGENLVDEGGSRIVWDDRWHEEEIFANRLSFYILAQSFLVVAAVTATLSTDATDRWLPVALTIDLTGLLLTIVFWYALTENLRRLDALKEIVAEGSREMNVRGYREIGIIRTSHHERRAERALPLPLSLLPRWSPSWWLAHGIPVLLGTAWIALITVAIVTAA